VTVSCDVQTFHSVLDGHRRLGRVPPWRDHLARGLQAGQDPHYRQDHEHEKGLTRDRPAQPLACRVLVGQARAHPAQVQRAEAQQGEDQHQFDEQRHAIWGPQGRQDQDLCPGGIGTGEEHGTDAATRQEGKARHESRQDRAADSRRCGPEALPQTQREMQQASTPHRGREEVEKVGTDRRRADLQGRGPMTRQAEGQEEATAEHRGPQEAR
jgi:hypothetical protein